MGIRPNPNSKQCLHTDLKLHNANSSATGPGMPFLASLRALQSSFGLLFEMHIWTPPTLPNLSSRPLQPWLRIQSRLSHQSALVHRYSQTLVVWLT